MIARLLGYATLAAVLAIAVTVHDVWRSRPGNAPSSHFRNLDRDQDGDVSYEEWKSYYASRSGWSSSEWNFGLMDCNKDKALSWSEYRAYTFKNQFCGGSYQAASRGLSPRPMPDDSFSCVTDSSTRVQSCVVVSGSLSPLDFRSPDTKVLLDERLPILPSRQPNDQRYRKTDK
jgi:hypothetical protein